VLRRLIFWLRGLLPTAYQVVKVTDTEPVPALDREMQETLSTLAAHPGFVYLLKRLRYQRGLLLARLQGSKHNSLHEVQLLQSGVYWSNWLEAQFNELMNRALLHAQERKATSEEQEILGQVQSTIELVGG